MLASAQAVDAKVHTVAGELALAQVADLHRVRHPAGRLHAEVREDGMGQVGVGDAERLFPRPQPAPVDFIGVGRAPVVRRGNLDFGTQFALRCHGTIIWRGRAASTTSYWRLFTGCSPAR